MPELDAYLALLVNGQSGSFGWKLGAGSVGFTASGRQAIRYCAIPLVRPGAWQVG